LLEGKAAHEARGDVVGDHACFNANCPTAAECVHERACWIPVGKFYYCGRQRFFDWGYVAVGAVAAFMEAVAGGVDADDEFIIVCFDEDLVDDSRIFWQ